MFSINSESGNIRMGGDGGDGDLVMFPSGASTLGDVEDARIHLDANGANIWMGGKGADGDVVLFPSSATAMHDTAQASVWLNGQQGNMMLGGGGRDGDIALFRSDATISQTDFSDATVHLDANGGNLWMGGKGADGDVVLFPSDATEINDTSQASVWLNGQDGNLMLGGAGHDGDIALFPSDATISQSSFSEATIHLDGDAGDIVLRNADCAEEFDTAESDVESGTVMVLDDEGSLRRSSTAYDTRVAGVVSGAGDYEPGIVLDRQSGPDRRLPIALMGKVFCRVDATDAPVEVGDMLTTAEAPGHAMKAEDPDRSFGAVIGKALDALPTGRDLVPVLVSLQ